MKSPVKQYNGIPIYEVCFQDYALISESFLTGKRLFTKGLVDSELGEYIRKFEGHSVKIGVIFEDSILDLRDLKKNSNNQD